MEPTPSHIGPEGDDQSLADLSRQHLPPSPGPAASRSAADDTASGPDVVRRHKRQVAAQEKRSKRASAENAKRLSRDGLVARLWHAAAAGGPEVAPRVQAHFGRCVEACLANEAVASYLANGSTGWSEATLRVEPHHPGRVRPCLRPRPPGRVLEHGEEQGLGRVPLGSAARPEGPHRPDAGGVCLQGDGTISEKVRAAWAASPDARQGLRPARAPGVEVDQGGVHRGLTEDESVRVRARTGLEPGRFWRAAKGRELFELARASTPVDPVRYGLRKPVVFGSRIFVPEALGLFRSELNRKRGVLHHLAGQMVHYVPDGPSPFSVTIASRVSASVARGPDQLQPRWKRRNQSGSASAAAFRRAPSLVRAR